MRAEAGEVLADRQLETAQPRQPQADPDQQRPPVATRRSAEHEHHDADQHRDLDQRERAPRRAAGARRAAAARPRVPPGADAGAGARGGRGCPARRRFLRFLAHAGGRGPSAKGQPLETLTRHQPRSMPRMPQRGRECQCLHSRSPTSSLETRTQRYSLGVGDHDSTRPAVRLLDVRPARDLSLRLAQAHDERVTDTLEVGGAEHARPANRTDAPLDPPAWEAVRQSSPSLRSRRRSGGGVRRGRARSSSVSPSCRAEPRRAPACLRVAAACAQRIRDDSSPA